MEGTHPTEPSIMTEEQIVWLARNLMRGVARDELCGLLVQQGADPQAVICEIKTLLSLPCFKAGQQIASKLSKRDALLEILYQLQEQADTGIDCLDHISPEVFFRDYYSRNRPVILRTMIEDWPALARWSPEYFKTRFGSELVKIQDRRGRKGPPFPAKMVEKKFGDFVDLIQEKGPSNDYYLACQIHNLLAGGAGELLLDLGTLPGILDTNDDKGNISFWFGPGNTVTPLHHDWRNQLFAQIYGRKRIDLIAATAMPLVYNETDIYSHFDMESPDFDRFPTMRSTVSHQVTVEKGDLLFIPVGWWHHVKALEPCISVVFSNFPWENQYNW